MLSGDHLLFLFQSLAAGSLVVLGFQLARQRTAKQKVRNLIAELEDGRKSYHRLKYQAEANRVLMEISNLFIRVSEDKLDDSITHSLKVLGDFFNADRAYLFRFSKDVQSFSNTHEWCRQGIASSVAFFQALPLHRYAWFANRILRHKVVQIPDVRKIPDEAKDMRKELLHDKVQSLICIPMICRNQVIGFLGVDSIYNPRSWDEDQVSVLTATAEILASECAHRDAELEVAENRSQFETLIAYAPVAMFVFDPRGRILFSQGRALARAGVISGQLVGKSGFDLLAKSPEMLLNLEKGLSGQDFHAEIRLGDRLFDSHFTPVLDDQGDVKKLIVIATDITERSVAEKQLYQEKIYDRITQLPNRTLFLDRVQQYLDRLQQALVGPACLMLLDLDRFTQLHDALGAEAANRFLILVADRLRDFFAPTTLIARVGHTEFAVLLENITTEKDALSLAQEVQDALRKGCRIEGRNVPCTASIGFSMASGPSKAPGDWLREGHTAVVSAKNLGGATEVPFKPIMHTQILSSWKLEEELNDAVAQENIEAWLQPIVHLSTGTPVGFEALARWRHAEGGMIPPVHFIPIAEENGLIVPIGWSMLHQGCRLLQACHQQSEKWKDLFVSVNLSLQQLRDPSLLERTLRILNRYNLKPQHLHFEITEREAMLSLDEILPVLDSIHQSGIHLSLDDFGTGYNSLSQLNQLPISMLKIDRSFVVNMERSHTGHKVISTILLLAQGLEMRPIAEGIETTEQCASLLKLGCQLGQGFLFSHPLDSEQILAYLADCSRPTQSEIFSKYPLK